LHPKDEISKSKHAFKKTVEEGGVFFESRLIRKDGSEVLVEISSGLIDEEKGIIQGIVRDITDRKKAQEKIREAKEKLEDLNENLEHKVKERTERINELLKQKDSFINQLGHDLKNPLGPFIQLLPILKKHINTEKDKEIVDVLERNAQYMRNLVKKTIELAKLNSSKITFNFEPVHLSEILDTVLSVNAMLFDKNDINIKNNISNDYKVYADQLRIEEVFTNLLTNAVKYTDGSGTIIIDAQPQDDKILISVADTGIGLTEKQIDHLFDEYYKADSSRHDFESSGLGLPICKRIIEKHDGSIWAESKGLGKGTTFYFTLKKAKNHNG